jgi:hypothetical protein
MKVKMLQTLELFNGEKWFILESYKIYKIPKPYCDNLIEQGFACNLPEKVVQ